VWNIVAARFNLPRYADLLVNQGSRACVTTLIRTSTQKEKQQMLGVTFMVSWMIWKEWNRRIFENKHLSAQRVASLIIDEYLLQFTALSHVGYGNS
jgi:hypothetical protein